MSMSRSIFGNFSRKAVLAGGMAVAPALALLSSSVARASETASATIAAVADGGNWQYNLTLTNTSTDSSTIGTFWFSWVPGQSFLASNPLTVTAPTGWENGPFSQSAGGFEQGASIEFQATSSGSYLAAGHTLNGFSFTSPDAPSSVFGNSIYSFGGSHPPVLTAFVYSGAPFNDNGQQFMVQAVPEPTALALCGLVLGGFLLLNRRRVAVRT